MKKLLAGLLLTSTILTGCAKGTIEMFETTTPTERDETTELPTTTIQIETTEPITEPPTEPPTIWEEEFDWATKEEMKEALDKLQVPEAIQHVILENNTIIDSSDGKEKQLTDVVAVNESKVGYIESIRTVDMDQDGVKELIISGIEKNSFIVGSYIVLKECNAGKVCVYSLGSHRLIIAEDGYIEASGGAWIGSVYRLAFDGYKVKKVDYANYDYEKKEYSIDGKEVSSEEFLKFIEPHDFSNSYIYSNKIRIYYLLN